MDKTKYVMLRYPEMEYVKSVGGIHNISATIVNEDGKIENVLFVPNNMLTGQDRSIMSEIDYLEYNGKKYLVRNIEISWVEQPYMTLVADIALLNDNKDVDTALDEQIYGYVDRDVLLKSTQRGLQKHVLEVLG